MAKEITDAQFSTEVLESKVPVLVDFWAPWCGPCKMVGPILEKVSEAVGPDGKVCKVNVDDNATTAGKFNITAIPTVMIFKNGEMVEQLVGVQSEQNYIQALRSHA
ncbi:MAG: thioredoxin [Fibrobacterota bacterium]